MTTFDELQPYTKSTPARMGAMLQALQGIAGIPGDIVECGVWRGGNIILARKTCPERVCWLYDTFDGMTPPDPEVDVKRSGERAIDRWEAKQRGGTKWDAAPLDDVMANLARFGVGDLRYLRFVSGPVEVTLQQLRPERVALLRLDTDWYSSTRAELEWLYPLLSPGGYLIVDDYGHWLGARRAVDEYFRQDPPQFEYVDYSCVLARRPAPAG